MVCIDCLRRHATIELEQRHGQRPRCPLCMIPGSSAAGAAGPSWPGPARSDSVGLISWQQLDLLLDAKQARLLHAALVRCMMDVDATVQHCTQWQSNYSSISPSMDAQVERQFNVRRCPHCGEGLEVEAGVDLLTATCPNRTCGRPLHVEDEAAERDFRKFRQRHRLRECPHCGATVKKQEGCNHITCRWGASGERCWAPGICEGTQALVMEGSDGSNLLNQQHRRSPLMM